MENITSIPIHSGLKEIIDLLGKVWRRRLLLSVSIALLLILLLSGCKEDPLRSLEEGEMQWKMEEEAYLNEVERLKKEILVLNEQLYAIQSNPQLSLDQLLYEDLLNINEKYPWLQTNQYDMNLEKVTIGRYMDDPEAVTITDPTILKSIPLLLPVEHRYRGGFPSGYYSGVGEYYYKLHTATGDHQVQVIGRGLIAVGEDHLKVSNDIHHLGAAFIESDKNFEAHIFTKIQNSGLMVGKKQQPYAIFSEFRIKGVAAIISGGVTLKQEPTDDLGELQETFSYYCQGEEIIMNLYPNHIHLIDGDNRIWLKVIDGGQSILSFLSAG